MCVSAFLAEFLGTKIYVGDHIVGNRLERVLAYANTAQNRYKAGPNAMLLHFPAHRDYPMGEHSVVDTRPFNKFMKDMVTACTPVTRSFSRGFEVQTKGVQIFDYGIYTVVMATDPSAVMEALQFVRADRRPTHISPDLMNFYGRRYPGWTIALCCFNNLDALEADPMLWHFTPMESYNGRYLAPAIDCHTGGVPSLTAQVDVDHWLFFSHPNMTQGNRVHYSQTIPAYALPYLPTHIIGVRLGGEMINGDFEMPSDRVLTLQSSDYLHPREIHRLPPPMAN